MTIEIAPTSPTLPPAKPTEGGAVQKSTDKPESGSASQAKSFSAALASAEDAAPLDADATTATDPAADAGVASDTALSVDKRVDSTTGGVLDPALLLVQATVVSVPDTKPAIEAVRGKAGAVPGKDGALALQAALDSALGKPFNPPQAKSGKAALDAAAQAAQAVSADASTEGVEASAGASAGGALASKDATPLRTQAWVQELAATLAKVPQANTLAVGANRERTQELPSSPRVPSNEVSAQNWAVPQGAGGAMGVDGVLASAATASADGQYAEQVSYWIGQDVQKAEMTLDGLGANPVEVSISMQGKEATVVFRSDEALTREALSTASEQLQDAMGRQGVVLSGVSVGTSQSGDSQRQGSGGKPHGWKVKTVEAASEQVTSVPRQGGSGRSIDLFV